MAAETERLDESNEGLGDFSTGANLPQSTATPGGQSFAENLEAVEGHQVQESAGATETPADQSTEPSYDHLPPELRPVDGKFPELNEAMMRKLRGKYFTVKHPRLTACGHKMDLMNEPRTNCEDCWFAWFNTHQKLVEVADEMYRAKGKEALIGMRGKKFFKMFVRFMVTIIRLAKEQEQRGTDSGATQTSGEGLEAGSVRETVLSGGQAEGSGDGGEVAQ